MRRRTFLQTGAVTALGVGAGIAAAGDGPATAGYGPMGEASVARAKELVVKGTTGYVAATDGFATVDLSSPQDPTVMAEKRGLLSDQSGGPLVQVFDAKVDGDTLVAAGGAQSGGDLYGFGVYDVSDPANPTRTGWAETPAGIHNCFLEGDHLYLSQSLRTSRGYDAQMRVWDISGNQPERVGKWSPLIYDAERWGEVPIYARFPLHDLYVQNGYAYCAYWDAGTFVLDVSDPANPSFVSRFGDYSYETLAGLSQAEAQQKYLTPKGNAHYARIHDNDTLYGVGGESWEHEKEGPGGPSGIHLYDLNDRTDPQRLSTIEPTPVVDATQQGVWTTSHNFAFGGDRLYSSWYDDGVKLHDVSDPASPELLAHWRKPSSHRFWAADVVEQGSYFAASSESGSIMTFPDESGTQQDKPSIGETPTPRDTPTDTPTTPDDTPTTSDGTPTTKTSPMTGTTSTGDGGDDDASPTSTSTTSPGFGALTTLGGLALGSVEFVRRRRED